MSAADAAFGAGIVMSDAERSRIRAQLDAHGWYRSIFERFRARVDELLARRPEIPVAKGRAFYESCPRDHAQLVFDPYEPHRHVCPKCGENWSGDVYDLAWLRQFQGWHAKRLVEAGIVYRLEGEGRYAGLVRDAFRHFVERYRDYPLANNLLGPTRLFQSTFLEAFWLVDMVAAYDLTRSSPVYSPDDHAGIRRLLYESCRIVQGFDEGVSNRQAFNNAGMGAVALLYDDEELLWHVLEGPHGFAFHMRESLLEDGIWYEGETYHFATLDHTLNLAEMARHRGIDLYEDAPGRGSLRPMFYGPLKVLLPDLTFPSRKDSWFGRGIGYHREVYELGYARYGDARFGGLLAHAYATGADRTDAGWRTFLYLDPELPEVALDVADTRGDMHPPTRMGVDPAARAAGTTASPRLVTSTRAARAIRVDDLRTRASERMAGTGLAVVRRDGGRTYAGLEYGHYGGGHGHPDRLHLTLFADGEHWLADPGTGWYHVPELGWYRSTLAHNTVTVDGASQNPTEGTLQAFGSAGGVQAVQAVVPSAYPGVVLRRTLCLGNGFLLDAFDVHADDERTVDWTFHVRGALSVAGERAPLAQPLPLRGGYPFLQDVERIEARDLDAIARRGGGTLRILQQGAHELIGATSLGVPLHEEEPFYTLIARRRGRHVRFATTWLWGDLAEAAEPARDPGGLPVVRFGDEAWQMLVDDAPGLAIVQTLRTGVRSIAWLGRRRVGLTALQVDCDRTLEFASLRWKDSTLVVELPPKFGEVRVNGGTVPATTEVIGLPEGAGWRSVDDGLVLRQASGSAVWPSWGREPHWMDADRRPVVLPAGQEGVVGFETARYQQMEEGAVEHELVPRSDRVSSGPVVSAPAGWVVRDVELQDAEGPRSSWGARVWLPQDAVDGEIDIHMGDERVTLRVEAEPPVALRWSAGSDSGMAAVDLVVQERAGSGARVRGEVIAPWLTRAPHVFQLDLEPHASHVVRLPLPRVPVPPVALPPAATLAPGARRLGADDTGAGAFPLAALVRVGGFAGSSRTRLPLTWCLRRAAGTRAVGPSATPADAAAHAWARMRLERPEQAYWAETPWAGPADASADVGLEWDDEGLHLDCVVRDDRHVSDANVEDLYENDSLQLYLDFRPPERRDASFAPGVAAYILAPDAQLAGVRVEAIAGSRELANRALAAPWFTTDGIEARAEPTAQGYRLWAFLPYDSLGTQRLRPGTVFRADASLSDNDGGWYRKTQLVWSGARGDRRCYLRWAYLDPTEYGYVIVGD